MSGATQVPWDRIIAAAAASTLGVLSLCVILVGVLAYLFFGRSNDRIKLGVFGAVLLAVAGLGFAVLRESGRADQPAKPNDAGAPPTSVPPSGGSGSAGAEPAVQTAASNPPSPGNAADATPTATVAGSWHDDDGFTYRFKVSGSHVSYVQLLDGEPVGSGDGTVSGRTLKYRYVDARTNDRGTCEGRLSISGLIIDGRCSSGQSSWGFRILRSAV